jgi:hypothetical protein
MPQVVLSVTLFSEAAVWLLSFASLFYPLNFYGTHWYRWRFIMQRELRYTDELHRSSDLIARANSVSDMMI